VVTTASARIALVSSQGDGDQREGLGEDECVYMYTERFHELMHELTYRIFSSQFVLRPVIFYAGRL